MLHADMKTFLQRRLRDTVADEYASGVVDSLLAVGIAKLLAYIHAINPAAFADNTTFSTSNGVDLYPKTVSSHRAFRLEIQNATTGKWSKIPTNKNAMDLLDASDTGFALDTVCAADLGSKWLLRPTPTAVHTIRSWYVPIITTPTGWDAVATQISPALHFLPVDFALIEGLAETTEKTVEIRQRIKEALDLLPELYGRTPEQVTTFGISF